MAGEHNGNTVQLLHIKSPSSTQACTPIQSQEYYLLRIVSDTVRRKRPFARRRANTLRPSAVDILSRKPCLFALFLFEGWNVLFIADIFFNLFHLTTLSFRKTSAKVIIFFQISNQCAFLVQTFLLFAQIQLLLQSQI